VARCSNAPKDRIQAAITCNEAPSAVAGVTGLPPLSLKRFEDRLYTLSVIRKFGRRSDVWTSGGRSLSAFSFGFSEADMPLSASICRNTSFV
jgi:hypothetical protein